MTDVIEVSYTGDILAHRRCRRAWCYSKQAGFVPYEQIQAMEGRLLHHAMEWMTSQFNGALQRRRHVTTDELATQLNRYFRILRSRGVRTAFTTKQETIERVTRNLMDCGQPNTTVAALIEGALHNEYELKAVRKVLPQEFEGKQRLLLTGVIDLVVQQRGGLEYRTKWVFDDLDRLSGHAESASELSREGDEEIWDYKGSRAGSDYTDDYVRQLLTYAALYRDRVGHLPDRCMLYFVNEPDEARRLLLVEVDDDIVQAALEWTHEQVRRLRSTAVGFERDPLAIPGGAITREDSPPANRITPELRQQCTACGYRYDCDAYTAFVAERGSEAQRDVDLLDVRKN